MLSWDFTHPHSQFAKVFEGNKNHFLLKILLCLEVRSPHTTKDTENPLDVCCPSTHGIKHRKDIPDQSTMTISID